MLPPVLCLASASPRRTELLRQLGVPHEVRPASIDESVRAGEPPEAYVRRMAVTKAGSVRSHLPVRLRHGGTDTRAGGLDYDHLQQRLQLNGPVRSTMMPGGQRAKPPARAASAPAGVPNTAPVAAPVPAQEPRR